MKKNTQAWKQWGGIYSDRLDNNLRRYNDQSESLLNFIADLKFSSVLEVGANNGRVLKLILDRYKVGQASAVDISREAIGKLMKRMPNVSVKTRDITKSLPYENNSFDLVFTSEVLCHISDDDIDRVRPELYRVARKYIVLHENWRYNYPDKHCMGNKKKNFYGTWNHDHSKYFKEAIYTDDDYYKIRNYLIIKI